ncbi:MAG: ATP-binding protein [Chloroflexi bacterium]|nr:MAG: ATP-binding protein [Chloroflexota bacterium]
MLFEVALAEIGANVLRYALPEGSADPLVHYELRLDGEALTALLTDWGPPLHNHLTHPMPVQTDEAGRGLAIARKALDELGYERKGKVNTWRLVKRL